MNISHDLLSDACIDELDNIRLREITGKAVSGTLVLLLKWFKRSRKFLFKMSPILNLFADTSKTFSSSNI